MQTYSFLATAAFGLEGIVARELTRLSIPSKAENGCARFEATPDKAFYANLHLRTADRVLMLLAEGEVYTFEDLYQLMASIAWENFMSKDAMIHVSGKCVRSQLMSVRDCQAVGKRAVVDRLQKRLNVSRLPETGARYPVDIAIVQNKARITLDMSGDALNRRGYRTWNGETPLRETLAAALIDISPWRTRMPLYDPCCGTGTFLIEAAIKATAKPAGLTRHFVCEDFAFMPKEDMIRIRNEAQEAYSNDGTFTISGSDIDPEALSLCQKHIAQADFEGQIATQQADLRTLTVHGEPGVFLVNPPYGERLNDKETARALYKELGQLLRRHPGWKMGVITSDFAFERHFGRRATKKRRVYNGRLECDFYIFETK